MNPTNNPNTPDDSAHAKHAMSDEQREGLLKSVNVRLNIWKRLWNAFLLIYFGLGAASVGLSAVAATNLGPSQLHQVLSAIAAVCVALLGFLRPEARYRNLIRAWRELEHAKSRFLFSNSTGDGDRLIAELARTERIATNDEYQSKEREDRGSEK